MVADHAGAAIGRSPLQALEAEPSFGTGDEESPCLIEAREPLEVDIATIHHVESASFWDELIENVHIVELAVADVQEVGILPRKSSSVCSFTAALVERNGAHGNSVKHRSMVVESRA